MFEQQTWQQGGPDKTRLPFWSLRCCRVLRPLWCCSGPSCCFLLCLSLVRSWWVGELHFSPPESTVESCSLSDKLPWRTVAGGSQERARSEPLTLILYLSCFLTQVLTVPLSWGQWER